jgi:predicted Zn-dependent protease
MEELLRQFPSVDAVVVTYARFVTRASQAPLLRSAVERVRSTTSPTRLAYLRHQVAFLEGDNEAAAAAATDWFAHEPGNPMAAAAALVGLGIGVERWGEALIVAREALATLPPHPVLVNNAAYVLAMAGHAQEAIDLLKGIAGDEFVMNATLGLAHLANGEIEDGMRLYRQAADRAESVDPIWRSLMTAYQALVVRQLGLLDSLPESVIGALALVPFSPPSDWRDRPDFLRLWNVAKRNGYDWPLAL